MRLVNRVLIIVFVCLLTNSLAKSSFSSKNEREFYKILKSDKYSSMCGQAKNFKKLEKLKDKNAKSKLLKKIFVRYVHNLANSCIDIKKFKKVVSKAHYKSKSQDYEFYLTKINDKKLLQQFRSKKSVEKILAKYLPKHPQFLALIRAYQTRKYSKAQKRKIKLNIERLKLLKYQDSNSFIQLNIPSTTFSFYEKGHRIKHFRTVVGDDKTQTPVLSSKLNYFVINPRWNIPNSIAKSTVIPKALKDKNYLKRKNIVLRKDYNPNSKKIDFKKVNWSKYINQKSNHIPYKFIQLASKKNGMGRLKFLFSNNYAVYMHDTIGSWRFKSKSQNPRFASHGCIRLEHPLGLMKYLTKKYTKHKYSHTKKLYDKFTTSNINLSKKLPIHLTYLTAVAKNGRVSFFKDRYNYDRIQKLDY